MQLQMRLLVFAAIMRTEDLLNLCFRRPSAGNRHWRVEAREARCLLRRHYSNIASRSTVARFRGAGPCKAKQKIIVNSVGKCDDAFCKISDNDELRHGPSTQGKNGCMCRGDGRVPRCVTMSLIFAALFIFTMHTYISYSTVLFPLV